jgi:hypothetical protein
MTGALYLTLPELSIEISFDSLVLWFFGTNANGVFGELTPLALLVQRIKEAEEQRIWSECFYGGLRDAAADHVYRG